MGNLNGGKYYQACLEFSTTIKNINATELYEFGMQVWIFYLLQLDWMNWFQAARSCRQLHKPVTFVVIFIVVVVGIILNLDLVKKAN